MTLSKDQFMNYNLHEMYALYCDYEEIIDDLQQKLKEKQLIIDAKKFADFKPIDNSRVGMTTPTMQKDKNPWTVLSSIRNLPPKDKIIEVREEDSFFWAPGILMKWSETAKKWLRLDGNESRNTWGEWRIAKEPWLDRSVSVPPKYDTIEVINNYKGFEVCFAHWYEPKRTFVKLNSHMYMTDEVAHFDKWRLFIK